MEEDKHSFQNILKLTSAMQAFETHLGASSLTPDDCVKFGINEQFKALRETLANYVSHESTSIENFSCVCNLCNDEVKIFDFDLKTSLEIHGRSEMHKILKHIQDSKVGFEKKSSCESMDLNNIPNELRKVSLSDVSSLKEKVDGFKKNHLADNNVQNTCSCDRAFCICDFKNKKDMLRPCGKMSNLNMDQKAEYLQKSLAQLPLLLPGQSNMPPPPPLFPVSEHYTRGMENALQSPESVLQNQNQLKKTGKYTETRRKKQVESPPIPNSRLRIPQHNQALNIHVHLPQQTSDTGVLADVPKPQAPNEAQNLTLFTEENFQKLQSRELNHRAEFHLIYRMVREVEGCYWSKGNFTKNGNEFSCNVCSILMNSSYDFVNHVRGRRHLETLRSKSLTNVYQAQPQKRNQKQAAYKPAAQNERQAVTSHAAAQAEQYVDERKQMAQMWRSVKKAEGDLWSHHHITKYGNNDFECHVCNVTLNSPFQLLQHVKGNSHQRALGNENENQDEQSKDCVVM